MARPLRFLHLGALELATGNRPLPRLPPICYRSGGLWTPLQWPIVLSFVLWAPQP